MAVDRYIESLMSRVGVESWDDTWIVDDIFDPQEGPEMRNVFFKGKKWVKLVRVDDSSRVPVRYLLSDRSYIYKSGDEILENHFVCGRAFQVEWDELKTNEKNNTFKRNQSPEIWYLSNDTASSVSRKVEVEKAIETEYEKIIKEVKKKKIPVPEMFSGRDLSEEYSIKLHVMKVGQGDTIVLWFPNNKIWIIDAYIHSRPLKNVILYSDFIDWLNSEYPGFKLERFIISHLHYDHIMSAAKIINQLSPKVVLFADTPIGKTTTALKVLREAFNHKVLYELV